MKKLYISSLAFIVLAACSSATNTEPMPSSVSSSVPAIVNAKPVTPYTGALLTGKHVVTIETTLGAIEVELNADAAPMTVTNFVELAKQGYYDGTKFHRVINNFMIQGGDPLGTGAGGQSVFGETFKDEMNAASYGLNVKKLADAEDGQQLPEELKDKTYQEFYELQGYKYDPTLTSLPMKRGAIAMANRGPNSNGSQFFIIQAKDGTPWLEGRHTVFGTVTKGLDILDAISAVKVSEQDAPVTPVTFTVKVQK